MIPFVDLAMVAWISQILEAAPVRWAHPEQARKQLAYCAQQDLLAYRNLWITQHPGQAPPEDLKNPSTGLPGITVFRMATPRWFKQAAMPTVGFMNGQDQQGNFYNTPVVPVAPEYALTLHSKDESDFVNLERRIAFLDTLVDPVNVLVNVFTNEGDPVKVPFALNAECSDPVYSWDFDDKTGRPTYWHMEKAIKVTAFWMASFMVSQIKEIDVQFKDGSPISSTDLDFVQIIQNNPPNSQNRFSTLQE